MRETQFHTRDHREQMPSGAFMLTDGAAMDGLIHRLHEGDPTIGWEGDPRLALAYNRQTDRWELWRCEHDGAYRLVAASKPGFGFPPDIIRHLMSIDGQRGYNLAKDLDRHDELQDNLRQYNMTQAFRPKAEKLAWALRRDLG